MASRYGPGYRGTLALDAAREGRQAFQTGLQTLAQVGERRAGEQRQDAQLKEQRDYQERVRVDEATRREAERTHEEQVRLLAEQRQASMQGFTPSWNADGTALTYSYDRRNDPKVQAAEQAAAEERGRWSEALAAAKTGDRGPLYALNPNAAAYDPTLFPGRARPLEDRVAEIEARGAQARATKRTVPGVNPQAVGGTGRAGAKGPGAFGAMLQQKRAQLKSMDDERNKLTVNPIDARLQSPEDQARRNQLRVSSDSLRNVIGSMTTDSISGGMPTSATPIPQRQRTDVRPAQGGKPFWYVPQR